MTKKIFYFIVIFLFTAIALPARASALEVSGWIPYWRSAEGAKDALNHIDKLDAIYPFGYTVNADGTLNDKAKISNEIWQELFSAARKKEVKIIPTVTWTDGQNIEKILSDKKSRTKHIKEIASKVKDERFDGVNIDYEGKLAATRDDFSQFLKELDKALGSKKILTCAVEARTPPESLYRVMPAKLEYANDYKAIGKYCDKVEILAYDQERADWKLNGEKAGSPYMPVADKDWVKKVVELALKEIPKEKIILGVPTYGTEYQVSVSPNWFREYTQLRSVTSAEALATASSYGAVPSRNKAGEMSYSYLPFSNSLISQAAAPAGTQNGEMIAQKALAYANETGQTTMFNLVWWSDSEAIKEKIDLAKKLGLKGIAIFKIDSEEDPAIWNMI